MTFLFTATALTDWLTLSLSLSLSFFLAFCLSCYVCPLCHCPFSLGHPPWEEERRRKEIIKVNAKAHASQSDWTLTLFLSTKKWLIAQDTSTTGQGTFAYLGCSLLTPMTQVTVTHTKIGGHCHSSSLPLSLFHCQLMSDDTTSHTLALTEWNSACIIRFSDCWPFFASSISLSRPVTSTRATVRLQSEQS